MARPSARDALCYALDREFLKLYAILVVGLWLTLVASPALPDVARDLEHVLRYPLAGVIQAVAGLLSGALAVAGVVLVVGSAVAVAHRHERA